MANFRRDFVDFWSVNRWLCQYEIIIEDDYTWVNEAIIVHPLAETPYRSTSKFRYWHPDKMQSYLKNLDTWTVRLCSFEQQWKSGHICPAFEYVLFPCPDGYYYAGYPASEPKHYVRSICFSPYLIFSGSWKEVREKWQWWYMDRGQWEIAFTAKRLWSCILREAIKKMKETQINPHIETRVHEGKTQYKATYLGEECTTWCQNEKEAVICFENWVAAKFAAYGL